MSNFVRDEGPLPEAALSTLAYLNAKDAEIDRLQRELYRTKRDLAARADRVKATRPWEKAERDERLAQLRGAEYPGMATMRWAADEIERLREALDQIVALTVLQPGNKPGTQAAREIAAAALERTE